MIKIINYSPWLDNMDPTMKLNGEVRCYVHFIDIYKACQKDNFLLPNIDMIVDSIVGHKILFMDGFSC